MQQPVAHQFIEAITQDSIYHNMKKVTVFIIQGYVQKLDTGALVDAVTFELMSDSKEDAEKRAKELVDKPFYRIQKVIETYVKTE